MKDSKGWDGKLRIADSDSENEDQSDNEDNQETGTSTGAGTGEAAGQGASAGQGKERAQITNPQALQDPNYNDPEMTLEGEVIEADEGISPHCPRKNRD